MSTAIQVFGYVLGGHRNCPAGDQWYKGEKDYLLGLRKKFFAPATTAMSQAAALVNKLSGMPKLEAQKQLTEAQQKIESSMDNIKDSEETLYEDFATGCVYTNSGNPISLHMRMIADAEAKKIKNIASQALLKIQRLAKQYSVIKASPSPKKVPSKSVAKTRPTPQRITPAVKACMDNIQRLIAIGRITPVSVPGGNIKAHCLKIAAPRGLGNFSKGKPIEGIVALAVIIWLLMRRAY